MQVGMVFAMIFAIILIGFIFIFAMPMLGDFWDVGNIAQIKKMVDDIETKVDDIYWNSGLGSGQHMTISLPADVKFCFIDPDRAGEPGIFSEKWQTWNQDVAIATLIKDKGYNIWYYFDEDQNGFKVNRLQIDGKNFCTKRGTEIYLENTGGGVSVSPLKDYE